jgi:hypothetical protein
LIWAIEVFTEVFFVVFSISKACCTEDCDSNTQVCSNYSVCFPSERHLCQRIWRPSNWTIGTFSHSLKSFKVLD